MRGTDATPSTKDAEEVAPFEPGYRHKRSVAGVIATRAALAQTPYSAMVEIADRCNEACVHCYQVQGQKGELGTAEWKSILDQLAELGVLFLTISGGEPTLRKDFLELVTHARQLRFAVKIYSNALNITESLARELGRLAVQEVQISLYSQRAEVHDRVTRVPGSFDQVVAAVGYLRSAGIKVVLKTPLMRANAPEYAAYIDFVQSLGAEHMIDPKLTPREDGSLAPTELGISKQMYLQLRRDPRFPPRRALGTGSLERRPCGACVGNVHLEANGEMRPCTQWDVSTGHTSGSLRTAWHENPAAKTIRGLTWNDLPGCRVCDLRSHCHRCFAEAEHYTGSALAPYGYACRGARWNYELAHGVEPELDSEADACDAEPIGPFRHAGEHRFWVGPGARPARGAQNRDRSWLPDTGASSPTLQTSRAQLVQIRRP